MYMYIYGWEREDYFNNLFRKLWTTLDAIPVFDKWLKVSCNVESNHISEYSVRIHYSILE